MHIPTCQTQELEILTFEQALVPTQWDFDREKWLYIPDHYVGEDYDEAYIRDLLKQLTGLGCKTAVLTGVSFAPGQIGAMAYDAATDTYASYFNEKLPVSFHGTGDVFASACVGALMNGKDLAGALKIAVDYTLECIRETQNDPDARWYGVNFESAIPMLVHSLGR